jgi:nicotinamidase-related amidase
MRHFQENTQKLITNEKLYEFDMFVSNVKEIIPEVGTNNIEVIYVRHDDGVGNELAKETDGFEIYEKFQRINDEKIFDKKVNSAFKGTGLLEYLTHKEEKDIIFVGLQTDYCIDSTIKCEFEHGFNIIVPAYANTTVNNEFMFKALNNYETGKDDLKSRLNQYTNKVVTLSSGKEIKKFMESVLQSEYGIRKDERLN